MFPHQTNALKRITEKLKNTFPERVLSVYAFGSRVRGDHNCWSDLDVLVIVKKKTLQLEREIINIFTDEEIETGIPFSAVIKDVDAFNMEKRYKTPFYDNVANEGVLI
jgi:predicted nucleotidyltransferase